MNLSVYRGALFATILRAGLLAGLFAGCAHPASSACDNGGVCPPGFRCESGGTCVLATCGNGQLDPGELCDDGNEISGDGCPADCGPACGDHLIDPGEACDDGNTVSGDGCSADCRSSERCGNGVQDPGEQCDPGDLQSSDGCSSRCTLETAGWSTIDVPPDARYDHAMAYDTARGTVVLFGGRGVTNGLLNDTWEWDGAAWRRRRPVTVPPARAGHAMAYDGVRQRVVMFGGAGPGDNGTWEWDGGNWVERLPAVTPPPLVDTAMAYDAARHKIVLFGGEGRDPQDQTYPDRTWEWDGETWAEIATAARAPGRSRHAMAYDSKRGRIVVFGGLGAGFLEDTWEYDGATWVLAQSNSPGERYDHGMAFDAARGEIVMFGGQGTDVELSRDLWAWDGVQWTKRDATTAPPGRTTTALVYDVLRRKIVLFSGQQWVDFTHQRLPDDTWEWDGARWTLRAVGSPAPIPRESHALAYDARQGRVVLFGGIGDRGTDISLSDTWYWDGGNWVQQVNLAPPIAPPPRQDLAMTAAGAALVMFGGANSQQFGGMNDTWALFDNQWSLLLYSTTPPAPRRRHAMAYDASRDRIVMFGGVDGSNTTFGDTWELDPAGAGWIQRTPAHVPPARQQHAMTYDSRRGRVVMFGGSNGSALLDDTWEWSGTDWIERTLAIRPAGRVGHAMTYDPARGTTVLFGGRGPELSKLGAETWEWDGADWHRALYATTPSIRTGAAMAYDDVHATAVMFGGQPNKLDQGFSLGPGMADTWLWDGSSWRLQLPAVSPPPRVLAAMAFDTARGRTVMFAGAGQSPLGFSLDDTWEWDGAAWTERHPATRPPPHVGHAMAYDAARDRTVMVGDILADGTLDQWQWDGTTWTSLAPASRPPGRFSTALAYDAERQKVVMFGGTGRPGLFGDTWEWDGTSWIDRSPASGPVPAPRVLHTLTYDPVRRRVVLFGGQAGTSSLNDVWEWDGTSWTTSLLVSPPLPREGHAMVYDAAHGDLVMFGGDDSFEFPGVFRDTWLLRYEDPARSREACDSGFDGDGDGKLGCEDPDCGALCARCGDAVCDAVESCRLCPGDCGTCHVCGDLQCDPGETCSSCPGDCGPCP